MISIFFLCSSKCLGVTSNFKLVQSWRLWNWKKGREAGTHWDCPFSITLGWAFNFSNSCLFLKDWFLVILPLVVPPQALSIHKSLFLQHLELSIWKNSGIAGRFHSCLRPVTILSVVSDVVWRSKPPKTLWCSLENTLSNWCCQKELFCETALSGWFCPAYMLAQSCNKPDQESPGPYCSLTSVHKSFWWT